jgi:hypothetical protein
MAAAMGQSSNQILREQAAESLSMDAQKIGSRAAKIWAAAAYKVFG